MDAEAFASVGFDNIAFECVSWLDEVVGGNVDTGAVLSRRFWICGAGFATPVVDPEWASAIWGTFAACIRARSLSS